MSLLKVCQLTTDSIQQALTQPPLSANEVLSSGDNPHRAAAVLLPLFKEDGDWKVIFIRRSDTVQDHKGQVAFPGGGVEQCDTNRIHTALREAHEEIGLKPNDVTILGILPEFPTISHYLVTPVIGQIPHPYSFRLAVDEVSRVFSIPLAWLADPANRQEKHVVLREDRREAVIFFEKYDDELLWGITAQITVDFLHIIGCA